MGKIRLSWTMVKVIVAAVCIALLGALLFSNCRTVDIEKDTGAKLKGRRGKAEVYQATLEDLNAEEARLEAARNAILNDIKKKQSEIEAYIRKAQEVEDSYRATLEQVRKWRDEAVANHVSQDILNNFEKKIKGIEERLEKVMKEKASVPSPDAYDKERQKIEKEYAVKLDKVKKDKERIGNEKVAYEKALASVEPPVVYIDKPIYIPNEPAAPKRNLSVTERVANGTATPEEFSHAAVQYNYNRDWVYEVYCAVLRTTDITLEANETVVENPFVADSERWMLGAGVSYEGGNIIQHIYIKPKFAELTASLVINTDRRVYHILLRSYNQTYMPIVRWNYTLDRTPQNIFSPKKLQESVSVTQGKEFVDPRFLSFDYKVTYGLFSKPKWTPRLVYDDGKKTYIVLNDVVLQTELPAIFENKRDIINYRVDGELIIIDKLIEKITIKYKDDKVIVEKKKK